MKNIQIDFVKKAFLTANSNNNVNTSTRREFVKTASYLTLGSLALPMLNSCQSNSNVSKSKRIAIIGAGIAGLSAAYYLKKNNIESTVFEASSRVGGRMFSIKDWAGKSITTDLGAEFVCEYHHDLIELANELKVELYDLRKDNLFHVPPSFFIEGKRRSFHDFVNGLQPAIKKMNADLEKLNMNFTYQKVPDFIKQLDQLSITQYLDQFELESWVKKLLSVIFEVEYGMNAEEQSCLNMLSVLKTPTQDEKVFEILGKDYEVLKIKGGTQALAEAVYAQVKNQVVLNHQLIGYDINSKGEYELTFNNRDGKNQIKTFDYLIITLPFKLLRKIKTNVDYPKHKKEAIDMMGYANNCKTIFGFSKPAWRNKKLSGLFFTDLLAQCGWDSTAEQRIKANNDASITFFYGGDKASIFNDLPNEEFLKSSSIIINKNLDFDFNKYYNQKTTAMLWKDYPYAQCSYTSFRVGEWTKYSGVPQEPFENIYFAGEHCDIEFQGFMNGALRSAKILVNQLTSKLNS